MNDRQEDKLGMYLSVAACCKKHGPTWQTLPAFVAAYDEFAGHVDAIQETAESQETGITGATRDKNTAQSVLAEAAYPVGTAVVAWATVEGNNQLVARVHHPRSDYYRRRDTEVESIGRTVLAAATENLADLADYGVTQAKLDTLSAAIDTYHAALTAPRSAITDRSVATAALAEYFDAADTVLKGRMDRLVPILASAAPEFGTDYENARIIVDSG